MAYLVLVYSMLCVLLFAIVTGCVYYKKLRLTLRLVLVQLACAFSVEVFGLLAKAPGRNIIWAFSVYCLVDMLLMGCIAMTLVRQRIYKALIVAIATVLAGIWLYHISKYGPGIFPMIVLQAGSYIYSIIFLIILLFNIFRSGTDNNVFSNPVFWLCTSVLTFYACNIPIFNFFNFVLDYDNTRYLYNVIVNTSNIVRYILLLVCFSKAAKYYPKKEMTI